MSNKIISTECIYMNTNDVLCIAAAQSALSEPSRAHERVSHLLWTLLDARLSVNDPAQCINGGGQSSVKGSATGVSLQTQVQDRLRSVCLDLNRLAEETILQARCLTLLQHILNAVCS